MITAFIITLSLILGLAAGSFLNVVILRGAREESLRGRSRCESCGHALSPKELIPLISFIIQNGKCRACGAALSWQYPLVEIAAGVAFGGASWYLIQQGYVPPDPTAIILHLFAFVAISAVIAIFVTDLRFTLIPDGSVITLATLGIGALFLRLFLHPAPGIATPQMLIYDIAAALGIGAFFFLLWFVSRGRWMGFGDVKLIPATSLILGFPESLIAFLFAFWIGGAVGLLLLILRIETLKSHVPFGPFILIGAVLAYFLTPWFLAWTRFPLW